MHYEQASVSELERDNDAVELGKIDKEEDLKATDRKQKLYENKNLPSKIEEAPDWKETESI